MSAAHLIPFEDLVALMPDGIDVVSMNERLRLVQNRLNDKIEARILYYILRGYSCKQMSVTQVELVHHGKGQASLRANVIVNGAPMNARPA